MLPLSHPGGPFEPLLILILALAADAVAGDLPAFYRLVPHPVVLIGRAIGWLERKLNREKRGGYDRRVRGALLVVVMVAGAVLLGSAVTQLSAHSRWGWLLELVLTVTLIAQRSLFDHVYAVARALKQRGLTGGQEAVSHIVGRDVTRLDAHGVARAAIESCAENFSDAVVAPVFWAVLFGFPGLLVYKVVNTMDSMIGHRNERYLEFGMVAARLDDAMNLIPARLSGLLIAAASAFVPRTRPLAGLRVMLRDARNHRSPNSGWPEAAMAGALDLALAGPRHYPGYVAEEKWIGSGTAQATDAHIRRALFIYAVACLMDAGLVALLLWIQVSR